MKGKRLSHDEYVIRANEVHNNIYDYSKTQYLRMSSKITITCKRHGDFEQVAQDHINGKQCRYCARNQPTETELLEKFKEIHPTLDFSKFKYTYQSNKSTFEVKCTVCDTVFFPCISNLVNQKSGCPKCNKNLQKDTKTFIAEAIEIHGSNFNYDNVDYTNSHGIIDIHCKKHDVMFSIPAFHHLKGRGCALCSTEDNSSYAVQNIERNLKSMGIAYMREYKFDGCRNVLPLPFDFYIESLNLCIEYDGAQHYKPIKLWGGSDGLKLVQHRDGIKTKYCQDNNINLLRLRYDEPYIEILKTYINEMR